MGSPTLRAQRRSMYEQEGVVQEPVEGTPQGQEPVEGGQQTDGNGNVIPKQRFDQVYGRMKDYEAKYNQYKEYGDTASLKQRLDQLTAYENALKKYREEQAMTPAD